MKLPGVAMLNFELDSEGNSDRTKLTMTARYRPKGLIGILYWYAVVPLHNIVFGGMLKGIRKTAETMQFNKTQFVSGLTKEKTETPGYGRARLWLGISSVGTMVTLSALTLAWWMRSGFQPATDTSFGAQVTILSLFVTTYALIQLPFDFLGGYWLPKRFGRYHPNLGTFLRSLFRGILVHGSLLLLSAVVTMTAGRYGGVSGAVIGGLMISFLLLRFRVGIACMMSQMAFVHDLAAKTSHDKQLDVINVESSDEGFTGGIAGVFRPRFHLLPMRWREVLGPKGYELAVSRRTLAIKTGSWWRGRAVALLFTAIGLLVAALIVGSSNLGTAWGNIQFSLCFSLWSFLGLLTLPTLSRRGVIEIDEQVQSAGYTTLLMRANTERLDRLQDGEPVRPSLVETIFHPVPSVENRLEGPRSHHVVGFWDAARTSIYLSLAGVGLLGRAVHCNGGRPSLWVFLPTD